MRLLLPLALALPVLAQAPPAPTPHHHAMKTLVGTWDATVKMVMDPAKPPLESKAVEVNRLVAGGLWLSTEFTSSIMGQPFEGRGLFGYDTTLQQHVGTWVDSTDTWAANSVGTCSGDGCKDVTTTFTGRGPGGKPQAFREVSRMVDADHRTMAMYTQGPDGTFHLVMEIAYTRRK